MTRTATTVAAGIALAATAVAGWVSAAGPAPGEPWIVYQAGVEPGGITTLHLVRPDGTDDHALITDSLPSPDQSHPAWSPDGDRIAFDLWLAQEPGVGFQRTELWAVDVEGTDSELLATCEPPCLQLAYPAWSPGGREIALMRYDLLPDQTWGPSRLEVLDVVSGERRLLAESLDGTVGYYTPRWSADGRSIVFVIETYTDATEETVTGSAIAVVPADGTASPTTITGPEVRAREPDWSPADRIVFAGAEPGSDLAAAARLWTMDPDGTDSRDITPPEVPYAMEPTWIEDGARIMFGTGGISSGSNGEWDAGEQWLATIDADGSGFEQMPWRLQTAPYGIQRTHSHLRPAD